MVLSRAPHSFCSLPSAELEIAAASSRKIISVNGIPFFDSTASKLNKMGVIFDLDETLVDTTPAEKELKGENFKEAEKLIDKFSMYHGIPELLHFLREHNIRIAVVSTSPREYCKLILQKFGIDCNCVVGKGDTAEKPSPAPMEMALKLLSLTPANTVSLGDRDKDIVSSKTAGIRAIGCLWGRDGENLKNSNADYCITTPLDAIPIIKTIFSV